MDIEIITVGLFHVSFDSLEKCHQVSEVKSSNLVHQPGLLIEKENDLHHSMLLEMIVP